jgi:hypothetical protein
VVKLTVYFPAETYVTDETLPLPLIDVLPTPLKFTQALARYKGAVPDTVGICAESMFGVVSVGVVSVALVSVLFVSVCVSEVPTTAPAGLPTPPAGNVTPAVPLIRVVMVVLI